VPAFHVPNRTVPSRRRISSKAVSAATAPSATAIFAAAPRIQQPDVAEEIDADEEVVVLSAGSTRCTTTRRDWGRRALRLTGFAFGSGGGLLLLPANRPTAANALVKGVAPPPPKKKSVDGSSRPKCTNIDECQALAEKKEAEEREEALRNQVPVQTTKAGTRYRDIVVGPDDAPSVKDGDEVKLYYKVLKLGKRSYDGLSGEGTVVFSRGYGLDDDESKPGVKSFVTTVGGYSNVAALNDALVGMKVGGTRRFAVLPQMGWRKPDKFCDGGPGGAGSGGEIKTDYVVVPTAQLVDEEACFDKTKQPFPLEYGQQRRMAQRFDQSLIMEVEVVAAGPSSSGL